MASSKQEFEGIIKLVEGLNKQLVKTGELATKAFSKFGDSKGLKAIKEQEKAIDDISKSTKALNENRKTTVKIQQELSKEDEKLIEKRKQLNSLNKDSAKQLAVLNEAIRKQNANLKNEAKRRTEAKDSLNQYRAQLIAVRIRYDSLNKSERENEKVGGRLVKLNNALDKKVRDLEKSTGRTSRNVGNYSDSIKNAAKESGLFSRQITILNQIQATLTALTSKNSVETSGNTVAKQSNAIATNTMTRAQKASTLATNFGTKSLKLFKLALVSTGVGALVVALGGLVSFLTSTQKGMDLVSKGTASVSTAFGVLKDRASDIGEGLSSIFSGDISGGFDLIKNSVKGVGDEIAEKVVAIVELKDQYQKLRDREIELIGTNAELRKGVEEARLLAKDENTTNAEKLKQLDLAIVKENELLDNQLEIASARAIIARGELDILKSTAEEIREVAELEAGVTELETANLKRRRTIASERLSLIRKIRKEQEQRELNDRKREIELIDDAEEQALAKELLRFDKALKGAIENKENLFLVNEVHEKRVRELTDRFAEERRKKLEDDAERERQIKEDANKKALSDAEALANFEAGLRTKGAEGIDDKENAGIEEAEQRSQFLLANDQLTADERALIELQLQDEISDIQKQAEEERLEQSKKATEEELAQQKELTDATLSLIETSTKQASDKKIKALDDELSASKEQQSKLQDLANKGSEDAVKSIALAQQREAELRREKEKEIQKQKLIEAGLTAFKVFSAKTEQGDKNALGNTITDLTTLQAFITGLSGFYEGTENVAESLGAPQLAGKDGHIIRVDGSERVIAGKDNKKMGGISNEKASGIIEMYNKGLLSEQLPNYDIKQQPYQSNEELLNEVKELQHVMKNLHKKMPQSSLGFDSFRGKFELKSKKGNNTTNYLFD